jgi:hypothetical protein
MSDVKSKLRIPAIGLIVVAVLNAISGVMLLLGRLVRLINGQEPVITNEDQRLGYEVAGIYFPIVSLLSLAVAPIIIFGATQMLKVQGYGLAVLAAILALIPVTSICCIPGVPIGIWALIVLLSPQVKAAFANSRASEP